VRLPTLKWALMDGVDLVRHRHFLRAGIFLWEPGRDQYGRSMRMALLLQCTSQAASISYASNIYIGDDGYVGGLWDQGAINDIRVYNRALSVAQIAAMYSGGK